MRLLAASLRKETRRLLRDRAGLLLWLGIPFSIMILMSLAFGGGGSGGPRPQGTLFLADQDGSLASGLVKSAFGQGPLGEFFTVQAVSEEEGRRRMGRGEGSALLIIPAGFQGEVLANRPVKLGLLTNPSQQILPAMAAETLKILAEGVHYLHLMGGAELSRMTRAQRRPSAAEVGAFSQAIYRLVEEAKPYLNPPLIGLEQRYTDSAPQRPVNLFALIFPGLYFMTLLFLARGTSDDIWEEVQRGTLRRLRASGTPLGVFLAAKLAAALGVAVAISALALAAARWVMQVPVAHWPAALGWIAAATAAWYLAMLMLQAVAGARARGEIVTLLVIFPSMMIGGSMFSFAMMPDSIAKVGRVTPLGWMVAGFEQVLRGEATAAQVWQGLGLMAAACVVLFALSAWVVERKFLRA
jgi:ABC-2 type transport system permease protein